MPSLVIILAIFLSVNPLSSSSLRIDCHPDPGASEGTCRARGCVWQIAGLPARNRYTGEPSCYFDANTAFYGYDLTHFYPSPTAMNFKLVRRDTPSLFGDDFKFLKGRITVISESILHLKIQDAGKRQKPIPYHSKLSTRKRAQILSSNGFKISIERAPFSITVKSSKFGHTLFNSTEIPGFIFSKQFIQFSTFVPDNIFGFGEHSHSTFRRKLDWSRWGMFARDKAPTGDRYNYYGSHPMFMGVSDTGKAHGVFFANSHAIEVALQPNPNVVTFRSVGGMIDLYMLIGPTADDVIKQYTGLVGRPTMPPYWGLGFQLCRFGYKNISYLKEVFNRNRAAKIPQDVQYTDIDYMIAYNDFTLDPTRFANFSQFVKELHDKYHMKYVPIIDPGISSTAKNYPPLEDGLKAGIFIRSGQNQTEPFAGQVWRDPRYWPDFTNPATTPYWYKQHHDFQKLADFDGVWNDMNEPSNEADGSIKVGCQKNSWNFPPYVPLIDQNINKHTVCMDAIQHNGRLHYELHNLYGYYETMTSAKVLGKLFPGKGPFILSRSTFPGSGTHVGHWTGDIFSTWEQIRWSIIGILDFNLFGIPWVGADICGFNGDSEEQLCVRWSQLGAFYPFSRNHNSIENKVEQDPAAWSKQAVDAIRKSIQLRYWLLPYLYSLFYQTQTTGKPVVRALFYDNPTDQQAFAVNDQFLWGDGLLVAPVLDKDTFSRRVYFTVGEWFDLKTGTSFGNTAKGTFSNVLAPLDEIPVFVKNGYILPVQESGLTTSESRQKPFAIIIGPFADQQIASGQLYWDDGESVNNVWNNKYNLIIFEAVTRGNLISISITPKLIGYGEMPNLASLQILGQMETHEKITVTINGTETGCSATFQANKLVLSKMDIDMRDRTELEIKLE